MQYQGKDNLEVMDCAENYNNFLVELLTSFVKNTDEKIMDFGAGNGNFARKTQDKIKKSVLCVEPAENMKSCFEGLNLKSSLNEVTDNSLDFIYSLNVLEHIENDESYLRELHKKLKVGGRIFIYVPAFPLLYSSMDKKVGHYRRYCKKELVNKMKNAGFKVNKCYYADSLGWFASLLYKMLPQRDGSVGVGSLKFYDRFAFPLSLLADKICARYLFGKNLWVLASK